MPTCYVMDDDPFFSADDLIDFLASNLNLGRILPILGAGISAPFKVPTWDQLVWKLYKSKNDEDTFRSLKKTQTIYKLAEHYRSKHCADDQKLFCVDIQSALYENYDLGLSSLKDITTLSAIGSLIIAANRNSKAKIITFNFDNILELYLQYHGFLVNSVYDNRDWEKQGDITIFHNHGYLPAPPDMHFSNELIFDQHSFSKKYSETEKLWYKRTVTQMARNICLIIGYSCSDTYVDTMLLDVEKIHLYREIGLDFWGVSFVLDSSTVEDDVKFLKKRGICPIQIKNYENALPEFLYSVCQRAAQTITV